MQRSGSRNQYEMFPAYLRDMQTLQNYLAFAKADDSEQLRFFDDIYGHDKSLERALAQH